MKLKQIFSKILSPKKANNFSSTLARIEDVLRVPLKEDFTDEASIKKINLYKIEYLTKLQKEGVVISAQLQPENLRNFQNIYMDLLFHLCLQKETEVSFDKINEIKTSNNEYLNHLVIDTKLKLYIEEIKKLRLEASFRIIALYDILEKAFLSKRKRKAIQNEINNLLCSLLIFTNQETAMSNMYLAYIKDIEATDYADFDKDEHALVVSKRLQELSEMMNLVMPDELVRIQKLNLSSVLLIALLEQKLEIFVYTHLDLYDTLKTDVDNFYYKINAKTSFCFEGEEVGFEDNVELIKKEKQNYLATIKRFELLFKIFNDFGKDVVHKKDLENLCRAKFKVLTIDILDQDDVHLLDDATFTELDFYQDFAFEKIEQIVKGKNRIVEKLSLYSPIPSKSIISYIIEVLKNGKDVYSMWDILNSRSLLGLLVSLDRESEFKKYFRKVKCLRNNFKDLDFFEEYFVWDSELSLDTIFQIIKWNLEINNDLSDKESLYISHLNRYLTYLELEKTNPLFMLYNLLPTKPCKDYFLPEGLVYVKVPSYNENIPIIKYINFLAKEKRVICPSSLKGISGNIFYTSGINDITLNSGIEMLDNYALLVPTLKHIILPYGLSFSVNSLPFFQFNDIGFRGIYVSWFGNLLFEIIKSCYRIEKKEVSDETWLYRAVPSFNLLVFYDENGDYVFSLNDIDVTFELEKENDVLNYDNFIFIWTKIMDKINQEESMKRVLNHH